MGGFEVKKRTVEIEGELEYHDGWNSSYWKVGDENVESLLREYKGRKVRVIIEVEES